MKNCENSTLLLLCENEPSIRTLLRDLLQQNGFEVRTADTANEAIATACNETPAVCLIDGVADMSGTELVHELRLRDVNALTVILSDYSAKEEILAAYDAGCDDYIVKPFQFDLLLCRLNALLRLVKRNRLDEDTVFTLGKLSFDAVSQRLGDRKLSSRENDLLLILCRHKNQPVEKSVILKNVWRTDDYFTSRSLAVYIHRLRRYLESEPDVHILSIHGKGFKLLDETPTEH